MKTETINKYKSKTVSQLRKMATKYFNLYIRLRDTDENGYGVCISSGRRLTLGDTRTHCGHYFSAGHYPSLAYNEDNAHLQSLSDNYFKSGNLLDYRVNLIKKIGEERVLELEKKAAMTKRTIFKHDRFYLIDVIEEYKRKTKEIKK